MSLAAASSAAALQFSAKFRRANGKSHSAAFSGTDFPEADLWSAHTPDIEAEKATTEKSSNQELLGSTLPPADALESGAMLRDLSAFICHASADKNAVRELYRRLSRIQGIAPWLDEENLVPGQDWEFEIRKALKQCDAVLVCLSRSSVTKEGYVQSEIRQAIRIAEEKPDGTIFLIPVKLETCEVPPSLGRWHWVDLTEAGGFERLVSALLARSANLGLTISAKEEISQSDVALEMDLIAHKLQIAPAEARFMHAELRRKDLPVWILRAVRALGRLLNEWPHPIRRAIESKSNLLSIVKYTNIDDHLQRIQLELARFIEARGLGGQRRFLNEEFRISITPAVAVSRALYVFPYFHAPSRRQNWGVLPYAQQNKIGFVLHNKHPAGPKWDHIADRCLGQATVSDSVGWFEELILQTDALDGTIYSIDGFVFYEILTEVLAEKGSEATAILAHRHTTKRPEEQSRLFFTKRRSSEKELSAVFVFDPGESRAVQSLLNPNYRVILAPHPLDVPVGVGFTLPCLPGLLLDSRWEAILIRAASLYGQHAEELAGLGIRLTAIDLDVKQPRDVAT
ncbi:MAG TPA: toll/interleukin-1 receptor domain-containing protein [Bryobacteraceae bacterium]|nr:toll/interleukin-1 receptor domain-containing protein [Bryobacteraceae bacterium]